MLPSGTGRQLTRIPEVFQQLPLTAADYIVNKSLHTIHQSKIFSNQCVPPTSHLSKSNQCVPHPPGVFSNQCVQSITNLLTSNQCVASTRHLSKSMCAIPQESSQQKLPFQRASPARTAFFSGDMLEVFLSSYSHFWLPFVSKAEAAN